MSDKKLAKEFVRKVQPLEHSHCELDRKRARRYEKRMRSLLKDIKAPHCSRLSA